MPLCTLAYAAEKLGRTEGTIRRWILITGMDITFDPQRGPCVDLEELEARWTARQDKRRLQRKRKAASLSIVLDPEMRDEIDGAAKKHDVTIGEAARRLLHTGLVGYYRSGDLTNG